MFELVQLTAHSYYIQSPAKIGLVVLQDQDVCLIDSGNDKDAGRKIRKLLDAHDWHLTAIYNTHANADHIGGNKYLQNQTGCRIYAPGMDCEFTKHPILEPSFLYGGYPPADLRHKFLMAQESEAVYATADTVPAGFEIIPLPGHFFSMVGYRTPEDVVFLADCLTSKAILDKYKIGFIYDVDAYLKTLEKVKTMTAAVFVPAHAEAVTDIVPLAQYNIDKVWEVAHLIVSLCKVPQGFEDILQQIFTRYELDMNFEQYVLVGSTVRSYLAWLKDTGHLQVVFDHNRLLWQQC
jgi:glyoxylase-like metal-dependent hydrolase (beta-lactamase superfamily II)